MNTKHFAPGALAALGLALGACTTPTGTTAPAAPAVQWASVASTDAQQVFVDSASLVATGAYVDAQVKQNYAQPQPAAKKDKTYLSSRNVYRFDCVQRKVGMKEIRTFSEADLGGVEVDKARFGDKNVQWLDAQDRTVFGELLDYVCGSTPTAR